MSQSKFEKFAYGIIWLAIFGFFARMAIGFLFLNEYEDWAYSWRAKGGVILFAIVAIYAIIEIIKEWKSNNDDK